MCTCTHTYIHVRAHTYTHTYSTSQSLQATPINAKVQPLQHSIHSLHFILYNHTAMNNGYQQLANSSQLHHLVAEVTLSQLFSGFACS